MTPSDISLKNKAFTLVELSIVLLIIGLVIGAISAGSALVQQAKLRGSINELQNWQIAYNTFKLQYNAVPGDMTNAYSFFGSNCGTNDVGLQSSCNGNGNNLVDSYELYSHAWQHLSLAGLINKNLNYLASGNTLIINTNVPASKYGSGTAYCIRQMGTYSYAAAGLAFNAIEFGWINTGGYAICNYGGILPTDAYSIDLKIDDGSPSSGKFQSTGSINNCTNQLWNSTTPATYTLNLTTGSCAVTYYLEQ